MADEDSTRRALIVQPPVLEAPELPALVEAEVNAARGYAAASRAASTWRADLSDWTIFSAWCDRRRVEPFPTAPAAVATFLAAETEEGVKTATIGCRLAAIGYMHRANGFDPPPACVGAQAIRDVVAGIRSAHGVRKGKSARPTPTCFATCFTR